MTITLDPNLKLSPVDTRDFIAKFTPVATPPSMDLKPSVVEVENQLNYNSCTANAGCSALELMFNLNGYKVDLSRMYLYYYSRLLSGIPIDGGAYPRDIGGALLHNGTCYESTWGYASQNIQTEPDATAVAEAENFKILSYAQITGDVLPQIKLSLAQNIPVLLTMVVHNGFYKLSGIWQTHDWDYVTSSTNPVVGLHEVLVIGYDDASQRLLVENSWGPNWGDGGFFGLPYAAVTLDVVPELWVLITNPTTLTYLQNNPPPPIVIDPEPIVVPTPPNTMSTKNKIINIAIGLIMIGIILFAVLH